MTKVGHSLSSRTKLEQGKRKAMKKIHGDFLAKGLLKRLEQEQANRVGRGRLKRLKDVGIKT